MRRGIVLVFAGVMMGGCATHGEILKSDAAVELRSTKDARALASCIGQKWSEHNFLGTTASNMTEQGYIVTIGLDVRPWGAARIEPEGAGSVVRFGERWHVGDSGLPTDVKSCL